MDPLDSPQHPAPQAQSDPLAQSASPVAEPSSMKSSPPGPSQPDPLKVVGLPSTVDAGGASGRLLTDVSTPADVALPQRPSTVARQLLTTLSGVTRGLIALRRQSEPPIQTLSPALSNLSAIGNAVGPGLAAAVLVMAHGFPQPQIGLVMGLLLSLVAAALLTLVRVVQWVDPQRPLSRQAALVRELSIGAMAGAVVLADVTGLLVLVMPDTAGNWLTTAVAALHAYLLYLLLSDLLRLNRYLTDLGGRSPARLILLTFAGVTMLGAALLFLPVATVRAAYEWNHVTPHIVNSLFTATSAVCVTGLTVYPNSPDVGGVGYTFFGQAVILLLIQIGGLSITIFGAVAGLIVGERASLRSRVALTGLTGESTPVGDVIRMARFIVISTLLIEAAGAMLLISLWPADWPLGQRLWWSVFHAVSAFCNAGFALAPSSLIEYRDAWQVHLVVGPLIVLGGIGFPVLAAVWGWTLSKARSAMIGRSAAVGTMPDPRRRLPLHSRVMLTSTATLIVAGGVLLFATETNWFERVDYGAGAGQRKLMTADAQSLQGQEPWSRLANAVFMSISARTAGFNTVSLSPGTISDAGLLVLMVLMLIGAGPASCAGGIKVIVLYVLTRAMVATLQSQGAVTAYQRELPALIIQRAVTIFFLYLLVLLLLLLALVWTQEQQPFLGLMFECISACGTVGLSTGLTDSLNLTGKVILIIAMFVGRIGPLTLLLCLPKPPTSGHFHYARESVALG